MNVCQWMGCLLKSFLLKAPSILESLSNFFQLLSTKISRNRHINYPVKNILTEAFSLFVNSALFKVTLCHILHATDQSPFHLLSSPPGIPRGIWHFFSNSSVRTPIYLNYVCTCTKKSGNIVCRTTAKIVVLSRAQRFSRVHRTKETTRSNA